MTTAKNDEHPAAVEAASPPKPPLRRLVASWLVLVLVLTCLLWVSSFTVLATHTTIARQRVYEALERDRWFPDKAGARLLTYVVALAVVPALGMCILAGGGGEAPKPARAWIRPYPLRCLGSCGGGGTVRLCRLEMLLIALLFVATPVATFVARVIARFEVAYWPPERVAYELCKTVGKCVAFTWMWVLLPVSKSSVWWSWMNFEFERVVHWHRGLAWATVALVLLHAVLAVVALARAGQLGACWIPNDDCQRPGGFETYLGLETSKTVFYGWLSLALGAVLVGTSVSYMRRRHFELFYYTHVIVFGPLLIFVHLHYPDMIYYTAPGLAAYILDKVWWLWLSRRPTRIVRMTAPAPGFVRLDIEVDALQNTSLNGWAPGQWVQINIPALSFWQWHPMSVAAGPSSAIEQKTQDETATSTTYKHETTIQLDIKVLGDWTAKLANLAERFDPSQVSHSTIYMDKFYGSSHSRSQGFLTHPVVVILAGGIGATPGMSALWHMIQYSQTRYPHVRKIVFAWCVKKLSVVDLYRSELAFYQQRLSRLESNCELEIIVNATLSENEDVDYEGPMQACQPFQPGRIPQDSEDACLRRHRNRAFLGVLSGCGCWLGIVLSNRLSYEMGWNSEALAMFQLFMLLTWTVAAALCGLVLCSFSWQSGNVNESKAGLPAWTAIQVMEEDIGPAELHVVTGKRPNVRKFFRRLQRTCRDNGFRSVGVSVCGPKLLVDSAFEASRKYSTADVEFVMDEESFDW